MLRVVTVIAALLSLTASGEETRNVFARITVIAPREGMKRQFEDGYKRHLDWHRDNGDKWTWYGWTVTSGERLGWFVDGTFSRTPEELDTPVKPAEDVADNEINVRPFGRFVSSAIYRLRPDLSKVSEARLAAPLASMTTVHVRAETQRAFEAAIAAREMLVYELVNGGPKPSYLLLAPADKLSQAITHDVLAAGDPFESATTELLRFRRDLTYIPQ